MAAERRHHGPSRGVWVLILLYIIWQKRRKGRDTWKSRLHLNSQPEGRPAAAFFGSPAVCADSSAEMLVLLSVHVTFLLQQDSAFGPRKWRQAVSPLQPFRRGGTELHAPALTRAQREEIRGFFWVSWWWGKPSDALWSEMQGSFPAEGSWAWT